jgi:hypothetical protein
MVRRIKFGKRWKEREKDNQQRVEKRTTILVSDHPFVGHAAARAIEYFMETFLDL